MQEHELFYLAGLFDGEGSFSIQVQIRDYKGVKSVRFNPRMTLSLKYGGESICKRFIDMFGGNIYKYSGKEGGMVRWNLSQREGLLKACDLIIPKLEIKKDIGLKFCEALNTFPSRANREGLGRIWNREQVMKVAKIALTLNPYRKSNKDLTYLKELEQIYQTP